MRYQPLPPSFHSGNRARLAQAIGEDAIAIIDTADAVFRSGDYELPFRPDSNFYYLTGIDQPKVVLLLIPGSANPDMREVLFIEQTSEHIAQWEGERYTQEQAAAVSGVKSVFWLDELSDIINRLAARYQDIYLNAQGSLTGASPSPSLRRVHELRAALPLQQLHSVLPILAGHRTIKQPSEIEQIRRAVEATGHGLRQAWSQLRPGQSELHSEAELTAEYLRQGATGLAFHPIVASGGHATVIHYVQNDAIVGPHDLVLFDTGAEVGWYASDISRTVPASGRFTDRQRGVYEAVWRVQQAGIALHKPGASVVEIDQHMRELLREELVGLKLITAAEAKRPDDIPPLFSVPYSSHHLGLDVHDVGDSRAKFEPGMVVTCEPGLYIKAEGIGVRLEDNIVITEDGCEVLSVDIPSQINQLEKMLAR